MYRDKHYFVVFEDVIDTETDDLQMRLHDFETPDFIEALEYLATHPKCDGIMERDEQNPWGFVELQFTKQIRDPFIAGLHYGPIQGH